MYHRTLQNKQSSTTAEFAIQEFCRLPKPGEKLWGLSRTTLENWCLEKRIRSSLLRRKGAARGVRLIHVPSLREYILNRSEMIEETPEVTVVEEPKAEEPLVSA